MHVLTSSFPLHFFRVLPLPVRLTTEQSSPGFFICYYSLKVQSTSNSQNNKDLLSESLCFETRNSRSFDFELRKKDLNCIFKRIRR